eukprot:TRINITY_DN109300_c0_g1_i1.p1 TRINITY_DN109300_c0_g1~~TRINITY_DN109300_c0_g1_i1.p1  ORF type:complete len:213 (+),score=26.83 TRINITY_DN109300_c0_g1_i1:30-641(+)
MPRRARSGSLTLSGAAQGPVKERSSARPKQPWVAPGRLGRTLYNPAIMATHSPDTGVSTSMSAWWTPHMSDRMADLRKIWHDTSCIPDLYTRALMTRQMEVQYKHLMRNEDTVSEQSYRATQSLASGNHMQGRTTRRRPKSAVADTSALRKQREIEFGFLSSEHRTGQVYSDRLVGLLAPMPLTAGKQGHASNATRWGPLGGL